MLSEKKNLKLAIDLLLYGNQGDIQLPTNSTMYYNQMVWQLIPIIFHLVIANQFLLPLHN